MVDTIAKALNILPTEQDLNFEELFKEYGLTFYNSELSKIEALKRNSEIVSCPSCGVTGNRPNMMRWHFENCKTVLKKCLHCDNVIPRQGIKDHLYKDKLYCNRKCYMESKKGKPPIEMTEEIKTKLRVPKNEKHKQSLKDAWVKRKNARKSANTKAQ